MSSKTPKYAPRLTALLSKHNEICNDIATLALQHDIHDSHVQYALDLIRTRTAELKKQLEQKGAKIEVSLPELSTEEKKEKPDPVKKPDEDKQSPSDMGTKQGF